MTNPLRDNARRLWCSIRKLAGFGIADDDASDDPGQQALDDLQRRLAELKARAGVMVSGEYRLRRLLEGARESLTQIDESVHGATGADIELRRRLCEARVTELESQVRAAGDCADEARARIARFEGELSIMMDCARSARLRAQIELIRAKTARLAMDSSLEEGLSAVDQAEERAKLCSAEAGAVDELNAALGLSKSKKESAPEQRITDTDGPDTRDPGP